MGIVTDGFNLDINAIGISAKFLQRGNFVGGEIFFQPNHLGTGGFEVLYLFLNFRFTHF